MKILLLSFFLLGLLAQGRSCRYARNLTEVGQTYTIRSPNYPDDYPNNADCSWRVVSPEGTKLNLNCAEVNIEHDSECDNDRLTVSLSGDSTLNDGIKICDRESGSVERTSNSNSIIVAFKPDKSNPSSTSAFRFQCTVEVIDGTATTFISSLVSRSRTRPVVFTNKTCSCGNRNQARIVGGTTAGLHEFPWRVTLFTRSRRHFCAGAIISPNWVMTAAHCTHNLRTSSLFVNVGDHDLTTYSEANSQFIRCTRVVNHPSYNTRTIDNDISLCQLERPVTFNRAVQPVCLPWTMAGESFRGTTVTASGWGRVTQQGSTSTVLRKVDLPVKTTEECRTYYRTGITNNMFCTYQHGKDTCQGDSGGTIDYREPSSGRYFGIGIVSWGYGCAGRNQPGVYAKVTNYLSWIQSTTGGEQFCR